MQTRPKIWLASDHAGLSLRAALQVHLAAQGHDVVDLGPHERASVDYPDFARTACEQVLSAPGGVGVLVCGTGIGMSMAANRIPGIRAALCTSEFEARATRSHNDANVLCLGERVVGVGVALAILDAFLATPFEGGRHAARVAKLTALERGSG